MIISGALAGLGGAVEGLGTFQNVYVQGSSLAIGFNGMAVSLLASNSPVGILFAAFLFSVLQVGAPGMNAAQVPSELVSIVTASITSLSAFTTSSNALSNQENNLKEVNKDVDYNNVNPYGFFDVDLCSTTYFHKYRRSFL